MKILIISAFFPPQNSIAALRPYSWAKYWSRAGHEVTVLTTTKKPAAADSPMPNEGFRVIELPIPGMASLRRLVGSAAVADTGMQAKPAVPPRISLKQRLRARIAKWQKQYGFAYGCRMPDPMDLWGRAAFKAVNGEQWDLVVSSAGPYSVHAPAYRLRKNGHAKKWIADWRDLWTDNHTFPGLPLLRPLERWLERRWCQAADALTTVSEPLAETLRAKYGDKVEVIYNGFDPEDYQQLPPEPAFPDDGIFRVVYTGSIYAGKQDPTPLFRAMGNLRQAGKISPENFQVIFCGNNANVDDIARQQGVLDMVLYFGFVPRRQALHMQRDANALLFLEFYSPGLKGILTGKLFEYLYAGPPILSVGGVSSSCTADVIKKYDRGFVFGVDSLALESHIHELICLNSISDMRDIATEFTRKDQAMKMVSIVK